MRLTTLLDTVNQGGSGPWPLTDSTTTTDDRQKFDQLVADFIPCRSNDPELWFAERTAAGGAGQGPLPRVPAHRGLPRRRHRACRAVGRLGRRGVHRRCGRRDQARSWTSPQERGRRGLTHRAVTRSLHARPATPAGRCTRSRGAPPTCVCGGSRRAGAISSVAPGGARARGRGARARRRSPSPGATAATRPRPRPAAPRRARSWSRQRRPRGVGVGAVQVEAPQARPVARRRRAARRRRPPRARRPTGAASRRATSSRGAHGVGGAVLDERPRRRGAGRRSVDDVRRDVAQQPRRDRVAARPTSAQR